MFCENNDAVGLKDLTLVSVLQILVRDAREAVKLIFRSIYLLGNMFLYADVCKGL